MRLPNDGTRVRRECGYSLAEVLLVIAILAFGAAIAVPSLQPLDRAQLESATATVAAAIEFARDEAIRTEVEHGVFFQESQQRMRVYYLRGSFFGGIPTYDVYDPITRQLYDFRFGETPGLSDISMSDVVLLYGTSSTSSPFLGFNKYGTPKNNSGFSTNSLTEGHITLSRGSQSTRILIGSVTGRVTIQ